MPSDFLTVERGRNSEDVWAGDYVPNWQPPNPGPLARVPAVTPHGLPVRDSINKQLAHFSLTRLQQTKFYLDRIVDAIIHDMKDFAENAKNVCYQELQGVRDLLNHSRWRTET
jgi:hypothetical protein